MAVSGSTFFLKGLRRLCETGSNKIDWDDGTQTIKAMLVADTFPQPLAEADQDALQTLADTVSNGGALSSKRVAGTTDQAVGSTSRGFNEDTAGNELEMTANPTNITFTAVAIGANARGIVIYREVAAADASRYVLCFLKFSADIPTNGSNIQVTFDSQGVCKISY